MRTTRAQVVALATFGLLASHAAAQPVVRIAAKAQIELRAERHKEHVWVQASVHDDQRRPLPGATISVEVQTPAGDHPIRRRDLRASTAGQAELLFDSEERLLHVVARFDGDAFHAPTEARASFDLGLIPVELRLVEPAEAVLDLGLQTHEVLVRARVDDGGGALAITLHDERQRALAKGATNSDGSVRFSLLSHALGAPGIGKLVARFAGDDTHAAAEAELGVVRWSATQLTFASNKAADGGARASGVLQTAQSPIARATVGLFDGDKHIASFTTDTQGGFVGTLSAEQLGVAREQASKRVALRARFISDVPWLGSSESPERTLQLDAPRQLHYAWLVGTPLAIGLLLLAMRMRASVGIAIPETPARAGFSLAPAARIGGSSMTLSCVVLDARRGSPLIATAQLVDANGEESRVRATDGGSIRITAVAPGRCELRIAADGYRTLIATLQLPHRGEWARAVVRLDSLRDAVIGAWSPLASQLAPNLEGASASTVRETLERAAQRARIADAHARALVEQTERIAYARAAPNADDVEQIEAHAQNVEQALDAKQRA